MNNQQANEDLRSLLAGKSPLEFVSKWCINTHNNENLRVRFLRYVKENFMAELQHLAEGNSFIDTDSNLEDLEGKWIFSDSICEDVNDIEYITVIRYLLYLSRVMDKQR